MATYWENSCSFGLRYVSWYKYLIVSLFFSHLGFWSGNLFLIAPFPDLCLLVPFNECQRVKMTKKSDLSHYFNFIGYLLKLFDVSSFVFLIKRLSVSLQLVAAQPYKSLHELHLHRALPDVSS